MRIDFAKQLMVRGKNENVVFLTGDLGYGALEEVRDVMGERFINTGISEQNMITVAAAMAAEGFEVWAYSIAPFCYARPFEQIRNDICFHGIPVNLIGNGGGYGYGVMGPTHHAIEDYGVLLTLPDIKIFVPAFDKDLEDVVTKVASCNGPTYLRLGRGEGMCGDGISYAPWRQLVQGNGIAAIVVGPLAGLYIQACAQLPADIRPNLWVLTELPLDETTFPGLLKEQIKSGPGVCVVEEHVAHGSVASDLGLYFAINNIKTKKFIHLYAKKHNYGLYGSQTFLRNESNLDVGSFLRAITVF